MNQKDMSNVQKDSRQKALGTIEDSRVFFVLKKTEKISSALFMITDVFNTSQSVLKKEIQEGAIVLLKDISRISTDQISSKESIDKIVQSYLYIKSLIDVAEKINCISENNKSILMNEINYCIQRVNELKFNPLQLILNNELKYNDFNDDEEEEQVSTQQEEKRSERLIAYETKRKGQVKDNKVEVKKDTNVKPKGHVANNSRSDDKADRQEKIKGILQSGGKMNIKDIVAKSGGVSSKTIQRDLNEMIEAGIVLKEGERRWSMYQIA